jgi:mono/diheme cytochrome c family protein
MNHSCKKVVQLSSFYSFFSPIPGFLACLFLCQCQKPALKTPPENFDPTTLTAKTPVWQFLIGLGHGKPPHYKDSIEEEWIEAGREIVSRGKSVHPVTGAEGTRISEYFYCIDCHNSTKEEGSLALVSDPEEKLNYAVSNGIPLAPGSTFAGIVNRESWYNGDYSQKYRFSLSVHAAQDSLEKAIELCCRECSQGRDPEPWEMEAMLAYFHSLQWTIGDLDLTGADLAELKRRALNPEEHAAIIAEIKEKYALAAPATFGEMPEDPETGYSIEGEPNAETGKLLFEKSCLHCHGAEGASEHYFGDKASTWEELAGKFRGISKKSIYGLLRLGTHPEDGKRPYMPNFTKERMSDRQIEDLRAFLEEKAKGNAETPGN